MLDEGQTEIPIGNPLRDAWETYKLTEDYQNTKKWAAVDLHVDGSLWAAFVKGWQARDAALRSVPPGSAGAGITTPGSPWNM